MAHGRRGAALELTVLVPCLNDAETLAACIDEARDFIEPRQTEGEVLIQGGRAARGQFMIMGDWDGSYDFAHLEPFVDRLRAGSDVVMGIRFRGGFEAGAMPILFRSLPLIWIRPLIRVTGNGAAVQCVFVFFALGLFDHRVK